jgi:putative SOS response-associated peptidase YedK
MCGRFTLSAAGQSLAELFHLEQVPDPAPRYNIAPTQPVLAVREDAQGQRSLATLRWGLVPAWAKDVSIGARLINARAESVADKPAFRAAFRHRRCLVPADGFYEWGQVEGRKQPYLFRLNGGAPFAIAGLWERWQGPDQQPLESLTLITTEANRLVGGVHERMPVILPPEDFELWLSTQSKDGERLKTLLRPYPDRAGDRAMEAFPVSPRVNRVENDDAHCVTPLAEVHGLDL